MRCVVTGVTGFTGFEVAKRLRADGHDVLGLIRDSSNAEKLNAENIAYSRLDFFNHEEVGRQLQGADLVFHIAAAYRTESADTSEFVRTNVDMTRILLDQAVACGVKRFVHCSTVGVQGEILKPPASEQYRVSPGDHYQESKLTGELLALDYNGKGIETTVVRPVGIYGPGDARFLKLFKGVQSGMFVMIGSGNTLYHMTYIDDLVEGFVLASKSENAPGEVFTICGPSYTTLNELVSSIALALDTKPPRWKIPLGPVLWSSYVVDWVCKRLGIASPLYPRRVEFFQLDRAFTSEKAKRMLGYEPIVDLHEGLRKTADAYYRNGLLSR